MSQQTVAEAAKELPKLDTWQKAVISAATYAEPDWTPPIYGPINVFPHLHRLTAAARFGLLMAG